MRESMIRTLQGRLKPSKFKFEESDGDQSEIDGERSSDDENVKIRVQRTQIKDLKLE